MLAQLSVLAVQAAEKSTTNPVIPDEIGEIVWGAIAFFGLWIMMRYVCLPPLLRIRAQREHQVQSDRETAAAAETQAEQVRRDYDATLGEARAEAQRILEEARAAAETERGQKVSAAESEAAATRQAEMADLERARSQALGELRGDVAALAVSAASKVVQTDLDPTAHRGTVDDYVNEAGGNALSGQENHMIALSSFAAEGNSFWLPHDHNEVYWGTAAFLIVAYLLWKFGRKFVTEGLAKRTDGIATTLGEAASAREAAEAERDRIKAALADSDSEAARIIEDARRTADQLTIDIAARAETDVAAVGERTVAELASTRTQAESDLSQELSRLALGAAERVVESSLDDDAQQRLIDGYISQVGTQN